MLKGLGLASDSPSMGVTHCLWEGEVFNELSLARVNRELLAELVAYDDIALTLRSDAARADAGPRAQAILRGLRPPPASADVFVRHLWPPDFTRPAARRYVHVQPWEFGALPAAWIEAVRDRVDEVWCYSTYVAALYLAAGIPPERVWVVPCGVDTAVFHPHGPRIALPGEPRFVFLYLGGTIARKGFDVAVNAYLRTFRPGEGTLLVVKGVGADTAYANMSSRDELLALSARTDVPAIVYSDARLNDEEVAATYRTADVLLLPSRGEGFGLPALEAMACGTPPMVTAGVATDDFVNELTGWRIPSERRSLGHSVGDLPLWSEGWMFEPDIDALAATMRRAFETPDDVRVRGRTAQVAARSWSWRRSAAIVHDRLLALSAQP